MDYIATADIEDAILQVTDTDISEANRFIEEAAARLGVSAEDIASPVTFTVKRLGVVFACYNRCLMSVGSDGTAVFDGRDTADIFGEKLQYYRAELKRIIDDLVASDFTGVKSGAVGSIRLWRS